MPTLRGLFYELYFNYTKEIIMIKFIFWAGSIEGLKVDVELMAASYKKARNRILKYIVMHKEGGHPVRGIKPGFWE